MKYLTLKQVLYTFGLATTLIATPVYSTVLAHIVLKVKDGKIEDVSSAVKSVSLSNCKHLVETAHNSVVIIRLECNEGKDIKAAISGELFPIENTASSVIWLD